MTPSVRPHGQDGDLGDGVGVFAEGREQGVTGFVYGYRTPLFGQQRVGGLAAAQQHAVTCGVQVGRVDDGASGAYGVDGGFVDEVGQVGAGEARRAAGDAVQVDVLGEMGAFGVYREDRGAFGLVRQRDDDLPVEAAWPQEGGIECLGPVGGRQQDDAAGLVEPVHLGE